MIADRLRPLAPMRACGRISRVVGLEAECKGLRGSLGDVVAITVGERRVPAQVVAVHEDALLLAPYGELDGVAPGSVVEPTGAGLLMRVGPDLAGRVLDALGRPIDGGPPIHYLIAEASGELNLLPLGPAPRDVLTMEGSSAAILCSVGHLS